MGLLDGALNLVKSVYDSVTGRDTKEKPAENKGKKAGSTTNSKSAAKSQTSSAQKNAAQKPSIYMEKKPKNSGSNFGDEFVAEKQSKSATPKTTSSKTNKSQTSSKTTKTSKTVQKPVSKNQKTDEPEITFDDIIKMQEELMQKCKELGIDYDEFMNKVLKMFDFNDVEFDKVDYKERMKFLLSLEFLISNAYLTKDIEEDDSKDEELNKFIEVQSSIYSKLLEKYSIEDMKVINKIYNEGMLSLKEQYSENMTAEEKQELFYNFGKNFRSNIKKYFSEKLKADENETDKKQIEEMQKNVGDEVTGLFISGSSIYVKEKDIKYTLKASEYDKLNKNIDIIKKQCGQDAVDSLDNEYWHKDLKFRTQHGEKIEAKEYGSVLNHVGNLMSYTALSKLNQDSYEYKLNCQNGEIDEPIPAEFLTQETIAIGSAITTNQNITNPQQRAKLYQQWDQYASEFSDYADVKNGYEHAIAEFIKEHPEAQGMVDELKERVRQMNSVADNANNSQSSERQINVYVSQVNQNDLVRQQYGNQKSQQKESSDVDDTYVVSAKPTISPAALKSELKEKSVNEVLSSYSNSVHEIIHTILHNDKELIGRLDEIMPRLEGYSGKDIGNMAYGCDTKVISKLITEFPDKSNDILDIVAPAMCCSGRQLAEQKVERQNEAA